MSLACFNAFQCLYQCAVTKVTTECHKSRYWNDKKVLQKLGEAVGFAVAEDTTTSAETSAANEAEGNKDEPIVHHCASIGDDEV